MALPINPTPILKGKEAERFLKKIEEDLKRPTTLVPTPKLKEAQELAKAYGNKKKQS